MRLDEASRSGQRMENRTRSAPQNGAWRSRRAGFFSSARLALLRASHSRWLLLVVALGILVADVLICTVPLYNTLVSDAQLRNAILNAETPKRNMQVSVQTPTIDEAAQHQADEAVRSDATSYLSSFSQPHPNVYMTAGIMAMSQAGPRALTSKDNVDARIQAFDYPTIQPYLHYTAGAAPKTPAAGQPIQVIITQDMADNLKLKVGQTVTMQNLGARNQTVTAAISGIFEPINANDPFWNTLTFETQGGLDGPTIYPVLTTMESFYAAFSHFQGVGMTQTWVYYADLSKINTDNMVAIADNVVTFRTHVDLVQAAPGISNVLAQGGLDQIIQDVQKQLSLMSLPLYVIAAQIVGLALLFVAAMASLLIEYQGQGIATMKSRGMSAPQLLGVFGVQSALLAVVAIILGPLLAVGLALLLIRAFLPAGTGQAVVVNMTSPAQIIVPALIGGALGIAVVTLSAWQAARLDVLAFRREMARPSRPPFWRRAYLDVGLAILCAVGYLELGQFGGTQARLALGDTGAQSSTSPLLLLTPALLLLAGGLLLLRLVPLAARLGTWLASRGKGLTTLLAFAQIERTPARYARLTLLLVLSVGLGLFALVFDASLTQNVHDRTAYAVGGDVRLTLSSTLSWKHVDEYSAHLRALPGVEQATPVYRTYGSTSQDLGNLGVDILGVDTASFAKVAGSVSWRSDYATMPLPDMLAQMKAKSVPVTDSSHSQALWAAVSDTLAGQMRLKVGDRFQLGVSDLPFNSPTFVVGTIIHQFPTLYPQQAPGGFLVVDLNVLQTVISNGSGPSAVVGPNEFWLRTNGNAAQEQTLVQKLNRQQADTYLNSTDTFNTIVSLQQQLLAAQANPTNAGMRGLLLIGALTAALLAVLGTLAQAVLAARQRTTQFAILRTLGMASRQLTGLLLGEQTVVYLFGLLGGTILGLILTTATFPFLTFSDAAVDATTVGIPSYVLRANWPLIGVFYAALVLAFLVALMIAARYAATIGLGKALRLGED